MINDDALSGELRRDFTLQPSDRPDVDADVRELFYRMGFAAASRSVPAARQPSTVPRQRSVWLWISAACLFAFVAGRVSSGPTATMRLAGVPSADVRLHQPAVSSDPPLIASIETSPAENLRPENLPIENLSRAGSPIVLSRSDASSARRVSKRWIESSLRDPHLEHLYPLRVGGTLLNHLVQRTQSLQPAVASDGDALSKSGDEAESPETWAPWPTRRIDPI